MHIITGLVMAHLFKRHKDHEADEAQDRREPMAPLLRLHDPVRTEHMLPGRVRFRVPSLRGNAASGEHLATALDGVASIKKVCVNTVTGSVLIHYDAQTLNAALLVAAVIKVLGLEGELEKVPVSRLQRELRQVSKALNRALYDQTNGLLDMKSAIFLSLAALGTVKLLQQRSLALPAGFTLLWWASNGLLGCRGGAE